MPPMGRPRKKNKHLPKRVYFEHGRYWFKPARPADPQPGWRSRIDLGSTLTEMYERLSKLVDTDKPMYTMGQVFDRYLVEVLPRLAPRTQKDYRRHIENLRKVYGEAPPDEITAGDLFEYRAKRAQKSVVQANREMACMSSVFREAIGWRSALGKHAITQNPCRQLARLKELPRSRYVTDQEYTAVYQIASPMMQGMMDLATMTGQREDDLLKLPYDDPDVYTEEGIVFRPGKSRRRHPRHGKLIETSKIVIISWLTQAEADAGLPKERSALWQLIERLRKLRPQPRDNVVPLRKRDTLICTRDGEPYTGDGFRSNWQRLMRTALNGRKLKNGRVLLDPVLKEPYTFNDLRAKSATDEEDFEQAHQRLAHSDRKTTQVVYVRKPRRAQAGRKVGA